MPSVFRIDARSSLNGREVVGIDRSKAKVGKSMKEADYSSLIHGKLQITYLETQRSIRSGSLGSLI
ncbi:hypothetical protein PABG_11358 [Paracoccidioides brasiliensis Pb03]|nr:hypothetical protein PABG_11358 [Paracoccidioides brasiliensis Pb03]